MAPQHSFTTDHDILITLVSRFDGLDKKLDRLLEVQDTKFEDHEKRIRAVEQKVWLFTGMGIAVTSAIHFLFGK